MSEHKTNCSVHNPQVGADSCDCGADEIERLERELAEAKKQNHSFIEQMADFMVRLDESEAQAAAMREALERAYDTLNGRGILKEGHIDRVSNQCQAALSTDAGRKVLGVVEAAKTVDSAAQGRGPTMNGKMQYYTLDDAVFNALRQALAAMGKP